MDFTEKWGTDVETAVSLALDDLKCSIDEVNVTVLEEPSRGFFGIGSKLALVRVEKKTVEKETTSNTFEAPSQPKAQKKEEAKKVEAKPAAKVKTVASEPKKEERTAKSENVKPISEEKRAEAEKIAISFLKEVSEKMGIELEFTPSHREDSVFINISGKDTGTIIGKRGQTLDSIQYLTSLVVNKEDKDYIRVVLDAENYRSKREKTLESLSKRLASKVVKTGRSVKLEPMNPYERKVIHATLQSNSRVVTRSEGQDPYRRVVIELK